MGALVSLCAEGDERCDSSFERLRWVRNEVRELFAVRKQILDATYLLAHGVMFSVIVCPKWSDKLILDLAGSRVLLHRINQGIDLRARAILLAFACGRRKQMRASATKGLDDTDRCTITARGGHAWLIQHCCE